MKIYIFVILFVFNFSNTWGTNTPEGAKPGDWSSAAYFVWPIQKDAQYREIRIPSPDRTWSTVIRENSLTFVTSRSNVNPSPPVYLYGLAEVGWASDSSALFLTRSDGGWVGSWFARVILVNAGKLREIDITQEAAKDFHNHISKCAEEQPNMIALAWLDGSRKLLLVAESPNHSSCPDMGNIAGYIIEVPSGRILNTYDKKALKAKFGHFFGPRLKSKYRDD
jgi:hypothetical protein